MPNKSSHYRAPLVRGSTMVRLSSALLCGALCLWSLGSRPAFADGSSQQDSPASWAPIGVIQSTPGVHITLSGGQLGIGASVDLLGGVVFNGNREFSPRPGVVSGGFAEVNAVLKEGVTTTLGWRSGGGALAPTMGGGYIPYGMATYDMGKSFGAVSGRFFGFGARALYFGAAFRRTAGEHSTLRGGLAVPLLPIPSVI